MTAPGLLNHYFSRKRSNELSTTKMTDSPHKSLQVRKRKIKTKKIANNSTATTTPVCVAYKLEGKIFLTIYFIVFRVLCLLLIISFKGLEYNVYVKTFVYIVFEERGIS